MAEDNNEKVVDSAKNDINAEDSQGNKPEENSVKEKLSAFSRDDLTADDIRIIERHAMYAACGGLIPLPIIDFGILFTIHVKLILQLADHYDVRVEKNRVKLVLASILGAGLPQLAREGTAMGLASAAKSVPGIGTGVGMAVASTVAYAETRLIGRMFAHHFRDGRSLVDLDVEAAKDWYQKAKSKATNVKNKTFKKNKSKEETHPEISPENEIQANI